MQLHPFADSFPPSDLAKPLEVEESEVKVKDQGRTYDRSLHTAIPLEELPRMYGPRAPPSQ